MTDIAADSGAYGKPSNLADKLTFVQHEFTDAELQTELEEAQREVDRIVGKNFEEEIKFEGRDQNNVNLRYRQLLGVSKVVVIGEGGVDEELYNIDLDKGVVEFEDGFFDKYSVNHPRKRYRDVVYVKYVPMVFADLERHIAAKNILDNNIVQTEDENVGEKLDSLDEKIRIISDEIKNDQAIAMVHRKRRKENRRRRFG